LPLSGPSGYSYSSNIKEIPVETLSLKKSSIGSPSSVPNSPSSDGHRQPSPFSRAAAQPFFGDKEQIYNKICYIIDELCRRIKRLDTRLGITILMLFVPCLLVVMLTTWQGLYCICRECLWCKSRNTYLRSNSKWIV